jgi:hypothetical protein
MNLPEHIKGIEVYYDGRCGMCCTFHEWVNRQPRAFGVEFVAYQSPKAESIFPGLGELEPGREIFRGAEAWVWCLYSCENHQDAARRLAGPSLLPVAIHACRVLAANRLILSRVFFGRKDKQVREELHQMEAIGCEGSCCATNKNSKDQE